MPVLQEPGIGHTIILLSGSIFGTSRCIASRAIRYADEAMMNMGW
jgi:hypothetical protein